MRVQDEENQRRAQSQLAGKEPIDADREIVLYRLVMSHLGHLPPTKVPANFAEGVMAQLETSRSDAGDRGFYGLLTLLIMASLLAGLMLSSQLDSHVVSDLLSIAGGSIYWVLFGLLCFIGIQWLDHQSGIQLLKKSKSNR